MTLTFNKPALIAVGTAIGVSLAISSPAEAAGFTDAYAPANFNLVNFNANGFVNTAGVPNSITITGGNNVAVGEGRTSYTTTAIAPGLVSFNWNYTTQDEDSIWDPFGYLLNGNFFQLTTNGLTAQNGTASFNVAAGDVFGFQIQTIDNLFGPGSTTISNFAAPIPTPALLPGLIGFGLGILRQRQKQSSKQAEEA